MKRAALASIAVAVVAAAIAFSAWAQDKPEAERPTLHQDIVPPARGEGRASALMDGKSVFGPSPTAGQNPSAFANGEKILPQPERKAKPRGKEPIHGQGGFAADRNTRTKPDRSTGSDNTLQYVTVFNPSVLPFKRMSAMNAVTSGFELMTLGPNTREDLDVGGAPSAERDLFWGSLMIQLKTGEDVAIPSVGPDMRLLSYEVEPRVELRFSKDSSDNYYVRSDESGVSGTYRLVFMADANALYFAPKVPKSYLKVSDVVRHSHRPASFEPLPSEVQEFANRALRRLDISTSSRLDEALDKLTYYFRGFSAKELPPSGGNTFWDLFTNKAGVCRHRSYAFMITATGLGLPTRYVTNEAHAWVEVWVPDYWMRIDLGGAALRMNVDNASDKSLHQPRSDDPFKSPEEYENNYTQLEGEIGGLTEEQIAERRQTPGTDPANTEADFNPEAPSADSADTSKRVGPGRSLDELPESATKNKIEGYITITDTAAEAFRGEGLPVSGVLREKNTDKGIYGQRIDIWLSPVGRHGDNAQLVGSTVTKADGSFSAIASLPDDMGLREYEVYATSPGDTKYAPALSD